MPEPSDNHQDEPHQSSREEVEYDEYTSARLAEELIFSQLTAKWDKILSQNPAVSVAKNGERYVLIDDQEFTAKILAHSELLGERWAKYAESIIPKAEVYLEQPIDLSQIGIPEGEGELLDNYMISLLPYPTPEGTDEYFEVAAENAHSKLRQLQAKGSFDDENIRQIYREFAEEVKSISQHEAEYEARIQAAALGNNTEADKSNES